MNSQHAVAASSMREVRVDPVIDTTLTASLIVSTTLLDTVVKWGLTQTPTCALRADGTCDPLHLPRFDRFSVHANDHRWRRASDWAQYLAIGGGALAVGLDAALAPKAGRLTRTLSELLIVAESIFVAQGLSLTLKMAVRRPRPVAYRQPTDAIEHSLSFPSGHTAAAAAASMSAASLWTFRHPGVGHAAAAFGIASALTTLTGVGRVAGGQHFLSDVLVGAALGTATGVLVPLWHVLPAQVSATPVPGGVMAFASGTFGAER